MSSEINVEFTSIVLHKKQPTTHNGIVFNKGHRREKNIVASWIERSNGFRAWSIGTTFDSFYTRQVTTDEWRIQKKETIMMYNDVI